MIWMILILIRFLTNFKESRTLQAIKLKMMRKIKMRNYLSKSRKLQPNRLEVTSLKQKNKMWMNLNLLIYSEAQEMIKLVKNAKRKI